MNIGLTGGDSGETRAPTSFYPTSPCNISSNSKRCAVVESLAFARYFMHGLACYYSMAVFIAERLSFEMKALSLTNGAFYVH